MRELKFRAWNRVNLKMWWFDLRWGNMYHYGAGYIGMVDSPDGDKGDCLREKRTCIDPDNCEIMQFTGLKDKNGLQDIYECDIIGVDGLVKGNKYENADLLQDSTNLIVEGFGTKSWWATYKEAVARGCKDSE